jgi:RNA polymerase sigma factor (TIGR02999 family)
MHQPSDRATTPSSEGAPSESQHAAQALFARVYAELRGLAHRVRGGRAGETLNTTALVHEAYLKLAGSGPVPWKDERHFFAVAARAMRQVLVDAARRRLAGKRGGGEPLALSYDDAVHASPIRPAELLALDEALERLAAFDVRRAQVVEHRMFAGLSTTETARLLGVSTGTVERDWRAARAWLSAELAEHRGGGGAGAGG